LSVDFINTTSLAQDQRNKIQHGQITDYVPSVYLLTSAIIQNVAKEV